MCRVVNSYSSADVLDTFKRVQHKELHLLTCMGMGVSNIINLMKCMATFNVQ